MKKALRVLLAIFIFIFLTLGLFCITVYAEEGCKNEEAFYKEAALDVVASKRDAEYTTKFFPKDITFYQIQKHAKEIDAYRGGLLCGAEWEITKIDNKNKIYILSIEYRYYITPDQDERITQFCKDFAYELVGKSNYEKVKTAHDYLIDNCFYQEDSNGPYNCLFNGKSNCNGYALAFTRMMQECRIPVKYETSYTHAWNAVKLDGYWYNIDVTWDDNAHYKYDYFLKSKRDWKGHKFSSSTSPISYDQDSNMNFKIFMYYAIRVIVISGIIIGIIIWKKRRDSDE